MDYLKVGDKRSFKPFKGYQSDSDEFAEMGEDEDFFGSNQKANPPPQKKQKTVHDSMFTNRLLRSSDFLNKDPQGSLNSNNSPLVRSAVSK